MCSSQPNTATELTQETQAQLADLLIRLMDTIERLSDRLVDIEVWVAVTRTEVMSRQQRLYDLLVPRFNEYFRDESEARAGWEIYKDLLGEPDRPFPGDGKKPQRTLPQFEA